MGGFRTILRSVLAGLLALGALAMYTTSQAQEAMGIEGIGFVSMPGDRFRIELEFSGAAVQPQVFMTENPARLAMDFEAVENRLQERRFPLEFGAADSVVVLESQGRTRMVVNLSGPTAYEAVAQGNRLIVTIGDDVAPPAGAQGVAAAAQAGAGQAVAPGQQQAPTSLSASQGDVRGIDFRRGASGEGQIVLDLAGAGLIGNVNRSGATLELELLNAELDESLQMRLDVSDFATPVDVVDVYDENGNINVVAQMTGDYDYIAYQSAGQYVLSISPVAAAAAAGAQAQDFAFSGERISMNFQDIDVRTALQILADFNDFSLVVSDSVSGSITLRLVDVPWDQALDLVLRARGLDQRQVGNVLYVAPAEEIASAELQELENQQQLQTLAPLQTEYMEINYAVASDLLGLLEGEEDGDGGGILSARGQARVDNRTNTLIVQDVASKLEEVRDMVERLDVPVRQVLIEARIVNASTNFSEALGIRWGGAQELPAGDDFFISGSLQGVDRGLGNIAAYEQALREAVVGGSSLEQALALTERPRLAIADALAVDLGVENAAASFALGYVGNNGLLELELSALESSGNGEVIAQPKVATQDKQLARIESGVNVPYQAQAGGTAGGSVTQFIPAVLSLEVTPQITPDNRIIMLLDIHQDSVTASAGAVPAISTNSVTTRVLVNDGETVVLGGVFREEVTTTVSKTPVLGDIPYLGNLFKRTENSENKTELLIFITPSILKEATR